MKKDADTTCIFLRNLPTSLTRKFKTYCYSEGTYIRAKMIEMMEAYIKSHEEKEEKEQKGKKK